MKAILFILLLFITCLVISIFYVPEIAVYVALIEIVLVYSGVVVNVRKNWK